jgi:hypothetical protein
MADLNFPPREVARRPAASRARPLQRVRGLDRADSGIDRLVLRVVKERM